MASASRCRPFLLIIGPYGWGIGRVAAPGARPAVAAAPLAMPAHVLRGQDQAALSARPAPQPHPPRNAAGPHPGRTEEIAAADAEIDEGFVFLHGAKGKVLDVDRSASIGIEYAVRVDGVRVVATTLLTRCA